MPRLPRLELPGVPLHITQRGINKGAIFLDEEDRYHFRHLLRRAFRDQAVALHAFVLMDNHFHLLVTPAAVGTLSNAMGRVGQAYVQAFNLRHHRCGALWQGRFKSCLVQSERYLLTVMRYIELNPVRAAMVDAPEDYRWSSVHTHLGRARDPLVTPHPLYLALGSDPTARADAYRRWLDAGIAPDDLHHLRAYARQERALGDERFQRMVETTLGRPASCRPRGRPAKRASQRGLN
ncbi:transposase [Frateuria terrea]|uniref:Putative transposase n=1 Tax=Frateuria terrea TaxID=529704 RepID=A0A1H6QX55_9GAMM|nr:transposase [Frateuria terrea]SEI45544.1 putative transposase [Frateuria terrea]SFP11321.1 putative transposase [Frateuria terrea]